MPRDIYVESWGGGSLRSRMDNAIRDCCVKYNLKYPGDTP